MAEIKMPTSPPPKFTWPTKMPEGAGRVHSGRFVYRLDKKSPRLLAEEQWLVLHIDIRSDEHRYRTPVTGEKHGMVAACIFPTGAAYLFRLLAPTMPEAHMRVYERDGRRGSSRPVDCALYAFGAVSCEVRVLWVGPESEYKNAELVLIDFFRARGLPLYNVQRGSSRPGRRRPTRRDPHPYRMHFTNKFCENAGRGVWADLDCPGLFLWVDVGRYGRLWRGFIYKFLCPVSRIVHTDSLGGVGEHLTVAEARRLLGEVRIREQRALAEQANHGHRPTDDGAGERG